MSTPPSTSGLPDPEAVEAALEDPERAALAAAADDIAVSLGDSLDDVAGEALSALGGTLALVNLLDAERQLVRGKAPASADPPATIPFGQSFCPFVVAAHHVLLVDDLGADLRTASNPARDHGAQAYAGAPIILQGQAIGTVCVIDEVTREWTEADGQALRQLADRVAAQLLASGA